MTNKTAESHHMSTMEVGGASDVKHLGLEVPSVFNWLSQRAAEANPGYSVQSASCQECKVIESKNRELEKQQEELNLRLANHLLLKHKHRKQGSKTAIDKSERRTKTLDFVTSFKNFKYNGRSGPLSSRFPRLKNLQSGVQPPEPAVKRLKGSLAKSVGRKIDGCDSVIFHPEFNILEPQSKFKPRILQ